MSQDAQLAYKETPAHVGGSPADVNSWQKLIDVAEESKDLSKVSRAYEALLEAFPKTPSVEIAYIGWVLGSTSPMKYQQAGRLFERFLKSSPFVDLWKAYLVYMRRMTAGSNTQDAIGKAFEFALQRIGQDKDSTELWADYIQLLKADETATDWGAARRNGAIRQAYRCAVQIPMVGVERLWEEYQDFENKYNKKTAQKSILDLTSAHMRARTALGILQTNLPPTIPSALPSEPQNNISLPRPPSFNAADKALVGRWHTYLRWEEGNPLKIEAKDKARLHLRLQCAYRKAVVCMRFYPEIWYMAYTWNASIANDEGLAESQRNTRKDESINILKAGVEANPTSFLLNFAYAEALELNKSFTEVHGIFETFLGVLKKDLNDLTSEGRASSGNEANYFNPTGQGIEAVNDEAELPLPDFNYGSTRNQDLSSRQTEYGVSWIAYMQFARRAESLKAARAVFGKARKDPWTPWEVYEAAALMEYHCTKATDIAVRIFEKAFERFCKEVKFILRYLEFLISIGDESKARTLFERAVTSFPPDCAQPIWHRWARYEYQFSSLKAVRILEHRILEMFPCDPPIKHFSLRYKYFGVDTIAARDLGYVSGRAGRSSKENPKSNSSRPVVSTQLVDPPTSAQSTKRPPSPDHDSLQTKRLRSFSPVGGHNREGDSAIRQNYSLRWNQNREHE